MVKTLTIVGLFLVAALALPSFHNSRPLLDRHADSSKCCCAGDFENPLPMASCGCRTCPAAPAVGMALIADFSKVLLPVPGFQSISLKTSATRAEARFAEPPTPPPRIPA